MEQSAGSENKPPCVGHVNGLFTLGFVAAVATVTTGFVVTVGSIGVVLMDKYGIIITIYHTHFIVNTHLSKHGYIINSFD